MATCRRITVEEFQNPPPGGWGQGFSTKKACDCSNTCDPCWVAQGADAIAELPLTPECGGPPGPYWPTGNGPWEFYGGAYTVFNFRSIDFERDGCMYRFQDWSYEYNTPCPCNELGDQVGGTPDQCGYTEAFGLTAWGCTGWSFTIPQPLGFTGPTPCCNSALS